MDGQPDGLALVGQGALDGLFDPPGGVGGELAALGGVKTFHGLHQADIALGDQIEQRQPEIVVIVGNFHHEPQIRADHVRARLFVALLDAGGEFDLLVGGQQGDLPDFPEIDFDA